MRKISSSDNGIASSVSVTAAGVVGTTFSLTRIGSDAGLGFLFTLEKIVDSTAAAGASSCCIW